MDLKQFYAEYQTKRNTFLDEDQFSSILMMYPSILIAAADGHFDKLEKQNLAESVKTASDGDHLIACEMYAELSFLLHEEETLSQNALLCIKEELSQKPEFRPMVLEIMNAMAESSEGVSEAETVMLNKLKKELMLN